MTDKSEMIAPPPLPAAAPPPNVSAEHLQQLAGAKAGAKKVRRAISVANFDGWTIGAFGALTLLIGLTDPSSIAMGLGMIVVAWIELRGASRLKRLDSSAGRMLGMNQIALAAILILYALWRLYEIKNGASPYASIKAQEPEIAQMLGPVEDLTKLISLAVYGAIILIAIFAQGGLALYYFTRAKHIEAYRTSTPDWIIKLQQAGIAL